MHTGFDFVVFTGLADAIHRPASDGASLSEMYLISYFSYFLLSSDPTTMCLIKVICTYFFYVKSPSCRMQLKCLSEPSAIL